MAILVQNAWEEGEETLKTAATLQKRWFKCAFNSKLSCHFKKDGGILNQVGLESNPPPRLPQREVGFFARITVGEFCEQSLSP